MYTVGHKHENISEVWFQKNKNVYLNDNKILRESGDEFIKKILKKYNFFILIVYEVCITYADAIYFDISTDVLYLVYTYTFR